MKTKETMSNNNLISIDPPEGWKYGFPKQITKDEYLNITSIKEWCIQNGYAKEKAESYGDSFYVQLSGDTSFIREKSTRRQALEWWNSLPRYHHECPEISREDYCNNYHSGRFFNDLTGREIEKIWLKEMQHQSEDRTVVQHSYKPNQKQFKTFNPELFKAYINKFSSKDKIHAIHILSGDLVDSNF